MLVVNGEMTPAEAVERFVAALQDLRVQAGSPGSRKIAARLGSISHTTVAEALSGRRIPTWPVVARIVEELEGDPRIFRQLWQTATNDSPMPTEAEREAAGFLARYRRLAASYYATMQTPDFDRRRRANMDEFYVPQTIIPWRVGNAVDAVNGMSVSEFDEVIGHTVLLGDAGAGKSALCQVLMCRHAKDSAAPVPYLITIRDFASTFPLPRSVVGHIEDKLRTVFQIEPPVGLVERQLLEGKTLIIFDGLDEVSSVAQQTEIVSTIEIFAAEFPLARVIVASRLPGYERACIDPRVFTTFRLPEFNRAQAERFVRQWFANEGAIARQSADRDIARELASTSNLPKSPLALAVTCSVYERQGRVPNNSVDLYRAYLEQRLYRWDRIRGVRGARQLEPMDSEALGYIAFTMACGPRPEMSESDLHRLTYEKMLEHLGDSQAAESNARDLLEHLTGRASILREVGRDDLGEGRFSFVHNSFIEYLSAEHLVGVHGSTEGVADALLQPVGRGEWHHIGIFVVELSARRWINGGERVVDHLISASGGLDAPARRSLQDFLAQCVKILNLPSNAVERIGVNDLGASESAAGAAGTSRTLGTVMARVPKAPPIGSKGDTGPWGWENAKAWKKQLPSVGALEIACYTDLPQLYLDANAGPFALLTPLSNSDVFAHLSTGSPRMGLVVRVEQYLAPDHPDYYLDEDWGQADPAVHHGGDAGQELAALLSLLLGIRMRAGGIIRVFHSSDGDPRGHPHEFEDRMPYLPQPYGSRVLPYTGWPHDLDTSKVELLGTYANLSSAEARALVRSARAYQEALWIAESDPRQAWLRLVSAVEAIAQLAPDAPAASRLNAAFPDIAERVIRTDDPVLVEWITTRFADQGRSTAKFLDFLLRFRPPPPRRRPATTSDRVNWTRLRKQLNLIYGYRSKDLHQGVPFPEPMCQPPYISNSRIAREVAYVTEDWNGDAPILLHMFEYVVRSALQAWWRSVGNGNSVAEQQVRDRNAAGGRSSGLTCVTSDESA